MPKYKRKFAAWAVCIALCNPQYAQADDNKEYLVKAAFIYNFIKFIEWPAEKAIAQQSKIDICTLGETPLSNASKVFAAASTPQLALSLVQDNNLHSIPQHCHVLFISESQSDRLPSILEAMKGHPVLLVSDMDGFTQAGGMIGFVIDDNKIKIDVNKREITSAGMRVDAQLLEIAHEVIDK